MSVNNDKPLYVRALECEESQCRDWVDGNHCGHVGKISISKQGTCSHFMNKEEKYVPPQATANAFKLEPRQTQRAGFRIDYIVNMRGLGQWLSIKTINENRFLFLVTEQAGLEGDPLGEKEQAPSDRV